MTENKDKAGDVEMIVDDKIDGKEAEGGAQSSGPPPLADEAMTILLSAPDQNGERQVINDEADFAMKQQVPSAG